MKRLMLGNGPFYCLKEMFSGNTVYGIFPQAVLGVLPGTPVLPSSFWGFSEGQACRFPAGRAVGGRGRAWRSQPGLRAGRGPRRLTASAQLVQAVSGCPHGGDEPADGCRG